MRVERRATRARARSMGVKGLEWEVGGDGTFMLVGTIYPWCTSKWCSTDIYNSGAPKRHAPRICLPPFPEGGPTNIHGACICGAPRLSSLCMAHPKSMHHGYGGLTPQALVLSGAHLSVAHPFHGAPRIRRYLWSISMWCATAIYLWSTEA
jgi:hypothetical protein